MATGALISSDEDLLWADLSSTRSFRWLFQWICLQIKYPRCRAHQSASVPRSVCTICPSQAATRPAASSLLQFPRHRLGSEPPPGFEDNDPLHADAVFSYIFGSPATPSLDGVFSLFKPLHSKALPTAASMRPRRSCCSSPAIWHPAMFLVLVIGTPL
jgi:hypothetical protein